MRFWSRNTCRCMGFHSRRFHSSIGVVTVSMSYCFLLVSLSSILSCLRRRILGVTPGLGFLGNPALSCACGWHLLR